jgi:putative ABC transport system substrate-binding protein
VTRRQLIALLVGAAAVWPPAARAQQAARRPLIVYLAGVSSVSMLRSTTRRGFLNGLRDYGLIDGQSLDIAYLFADGKFDRLPALAEQAVGLKPNIILAPAQAGALTARRATNPERQGLAASIARPGGNVTGILRYVDGLAGKHLDLIQELVPTMTKLGALVGPESAGQRRDLETAVRATGVKVIAVEIRTLDELEPAITSLATAQVDALMIPADSLFFGAHRQISAQALNLRLPTIWTMREMIMEGGFVSYGVDESESFRRTGYYIDKILKGASPADLPIELPTKFELVINLKAAKALGLTIPETFLLRADEVIE